MGHNRFNEREIHPNNHINFINALPMPDVPTPYSEEDARQLLRALAAQVRPIMKDHGFAVNSFEEYEYNRVFAGRNWNAGEVVGDAELVLRRADGTFEATSWLMSTLCHELAHIKHMNHGPAFQRLWAQLRNEVKALQNKGYYGDGYWSSGTRLVDSTRVGGQGISDHDLPEYICGGAQTRSRPKSMSRRRRRPAVSGPSNFTGAQVEKKRKPGSRVTAQGKFKGAGQSLNHDLSDEEAKAKGSGFRKQAGSKRAREERALAAEKRLKTLQGNVEIPKPEPPDSDDDGEGDDAKDPETDDIRRRMMRDVMKESELDSMRRFMADFLADSKHSEKALKEKGETRSDEVSGREGNLSDLHSASMASTLHSDEEGKMTRENIKPFQSSKVVNPSGSSGTSRSTSIRNIVNEEMATRTKESLGKIGGRKLGSRPSTASSKAMEAAEQIGSTSDSRQTDGWACLVCTLENIPTYLACAACNTPRGELSWREP